eukprot:gene9184-12388_t
MKDQKDIETEYEKIKSTLNKYKSDNFSSVSNRQRRILYSECQLLIYDVEEFQQETIKDDNEKKHEKNKLLNDISTDLQSISDTLKCTYAKLPPNTSFLMSKLDELIRLIAVWLFLISSAIFIALPCLLFSPIDTLLAQLNIIHPNNKFTNLFKVFVSKTIMKLSGIHLVVQDYDTNTFGKECVLTCFSHSSSMDAFIIGAVVPARHFTPSKSDLFLIPYFSWLLLAFGGIPVNRGSRDQAVLALGHAAASASKGDCIAIAPEGTRSKTGQILPFKKGPFYLWEQLKTPIIPVVILGAYDLYPPGRQMAIAGKVYVRYLKPIYPHEASTREEMSRLLRKRMLQDIFESPDDVAAPLTIEQKQSNRTHLFGLFASHAALWKLLVFSSKTILNRYQMSQLKFVLILFGLSMVYTILMYIYLVYIQFWLAKSPKKAKKEQ